MPAPLRTVIFGAVALGVAAGAARFLRQRGDRGADHSATAGVRPSVVAAEVQPSLVVDAPGEEIDFGPVRRGETRVRDVTLRNGGTGELSLTGIHAGCGCLRASLEGPRELGPGATASARVTLDAAPNLEGPIRKPVHVNSSDPAHPTAVLWVRADIQVGIVVAEPFADFGVVGPDMPAISIVHLRSPAAEPPWAVSQVTGAHGKYDVRTVPGKSENPAYRILLLELMRVELPAPGRSTDVLRVRTTHPDHAELLIQARIEVLER